MNILLEYVIVFILIFIINYFMHIKNHTKYQKNKLPTELLYLKKVYNIKVSKDNYKHLVYVYSTTNSIIITTIYIILMYLVDGWILRIILGIILLILLIIICYGILGRYYQKKEGRKNV